MKTNFLVVEYSKDRYDRFDVGMNGTQGKLTKIDIEKDIISLIYEENGTKYEQIIYTNTVQSITRKL